MDNPSASQTSPTLLAQLRRDPTDQQAWGRFVQLYSPKIESWCRAWQLQEADILDVTQNVLVKLATKIKSFQYDPTRSFRAWLRTLTRNALSDFLEAQQRVTVGAGDSKVLALLHNVAVREDLCKYLEEAFDQELLAEAMVRVRLRVAPRTWEAFRLTALESLSGAEAAERLQMKVANVFVAKSEVQKMLREEIQSLESGTE